MRTFNSMLKLMTASVLVLILAGPAGALFDNKFEQEVTKENEAVKLVRDVKRGGYDVVDTVELRQCEDMVGNTFLIDHDPFMSGW